MPRPCPAEGEYPSWNPPFHEKRKWKSGNCSICRRQFHLPPREASVPPFLFSAKKHFDRYAKLKRTKDFLTNRIKEEESLYEYALTIEHAVSNLTASDPTEEIENELFALGALHVKTKRNKNNFILQIRNQPLTLGKPAGGCAFPPSLVW